MKQNPAQKSVLYSHVVLLVAIISVIVFLLMQATETKLPHLALPIPSPTPTAKVFQASSSMDKFTITVPVGFVAEEKIITITVQNNIGKIIINRVGTNYNNLIDHLSNPNNNLLKLMKNRQILMIDNLESISGIIENEKFYFILDKNTHAVYYLSANNQSLYPILDQIAQSFKLP